MDKAMMVLGYITAIALTGGAIVCIAVQSLYLLKNMWVINLRKLDKDQLRHLISSASALLEQKELSKH